MKQQQLNVILPCLNEEASVGESIDKIKQLSQSHNLDIKIIVSDNGSTDNSSKIIKQKKVEYVYEPKRGYGNAYLAGLKKANEEILIMADPDGSYDFNEIPRFLENLKNNDLVIGNRFNSKMEKGAMPWLHEKIGNPIIRFFLRLNKLKTKEVCTGFIGIKKQELEKMNLQKTGMEFSSEILVKAAKNNLKIKEININYKNRKGKSKLMPLTDGWRHLKYLTKELLQ
jgi:glycosyltransferase involved in cell wall biosynthesis